MEEWKPVVGWQYEVSSLGKVRNRHGQVLKPFPNGNGYLMVGLHRDGIKTKRMVHHLVCEAFIGPRPDGMETLHGPNGKLDNSVTNLRWGTRVENAADRKRDGTEATGERHGQSKLNKDDVREIRRLYSQGWTQRRIGRRFGVHHTNVGLITRKETWTHAA